MVWKIHSNYISQLLFLSECRFHRLSFNEIEITRNENSESICHANREYRTFYAMNKVQLMLFSFYRSSLGLVCRITANRIKATTWHRFNVHHSPLFDILHLLCSSGTHENHFACCSQRHDRVAALAPIPMLQLCSNPML